MFCSTSEKQYPSRLSWVKRSEKRKLETAGREKGGVQALILSGAGCEAIITLTGVAPQGVEATPVLTDPRLGLTFILIYAALSIRSSLVPWAADAHVGTDEVLALHLLFSTVVLPLCTLILIFTHPPVFSQNISNRALAFIGPIGIYTAEGAE